MLMGAVALLLVVACANVAGLLLARGSTRGPEMAVRSVMGAGKGRLTRQLLTENGILAMGAGVIGLGLAICRDLTEMMGGRIGVHTKDGQGSTFWFTVRLRKCSTVRAEPETAPKLEAPATHGLPVLLVTPNPENAAQIFVALQKAGFRVNVALSRVQFLEAIKAEVYGAAVVDGERPELIATVANWTRVEGVERVPVIGLPYQTDNDGTKVVDLDQLQKSLGPLLSSETTAVNNP